MSIILRGVGWHGLAYAAMGMSANVPSVIVQVAIDICIAMTLIIVITVVVYVVVKPSASIVHTVLVCVVSAVHAQLALVCTITLC